MSKTTLLTNFWRALTNDQIPEWFPAGKKVRNRRKTSRWNSESNIHNWETSFSGKLLEIYPSTACARRICVRRFSMASNILVWPQWWSFADVSQQGIDFSKKISKIKIFFWFDFHKCSHGPYIRKIRTFSDIEKWLWKSDLGTFWRPVWTSVKVKSKEYFYYTDFFTKMTHVNKTPPLRSHYCMYSRWGK